jgi:ATP-dependent DNA helicase RecG
LTSSSKSKTKIEECKTKSEKTRKINNKNELSKNNELSLLTPITKLVKNRRRTNALAQLGVNTLQDLLEDIPRRLEPPAKFVRSIKELRFNFDKNNKNQKFIVEVKIGEQNIIPMKGHGSKLENVLLDQNNNRIIAVFFAKNYRYLSWLKNSHKQGEKVLIVGTLSLFQSLQFVHPLMFSSFLDNKRQEIISKFTKPTPIYSASSKISTDKIHQTILGVIEELKNKKNKQGKLVVKGLLPNILPPNLGQDRWKIIMNLHNPANESDFEESVNQMRFEEALILQAVLAKQRSDISHLKSRDFRKVVDKFRVKLLDSLPFELTKTQKKAVDEISQGISANFPMRRLLQGDVGSGKTIVALLAMLQVLDQEGQSVFLAPTEVLATQHYLSIKKLLKDILPNFDQQVVLLTSNLKIKERRLVLSRIKSGQAKIIVGTTSVLAKDIEYLNLGLIVVDEQQRFGVEQRDKLLQVSDDKLIPHLLMLSATPIPRSLAMTVFADLQVSILSEVPTGRIKTKTFVIKPESEVWLNRLWQKVREEAELGHSIFIVAPQIGDGGDDEQNVEYENSENETGDIIAAKNIFDKLIAALPDIENSENEKDNVTVTKLEEKLKYNPELENLKFGVIHGKIKPEKKEEIMKEFREGEINILLATSVVEVGIDISSATIMIIYDADRFSLSTLHQLRGRIGRGNLPATCFLMMSQSPTEIGLERLRVMSKTTNGFEIAEMDLQLRSEGDVIGAKQSGSQNSLRLLQVLKDKDIIEKAYDLVNNHAWTDGLKQAVETEIAETQRDYLAKV